MDHIFFIFLYLQIYVFGFGHGLDLDSMFAEGDLCYVEIFWIEVLHAPHCPGLPMLLRRQHKPHDIDQFNHRKLSLPQGMHDLVRLGLHD